MAKLEVGVPSRDIAESLVRAVNADNINMHGLTVRPRTSPTTATFNITYTGKIETFISTLDDLVRCLQAAKDTIDTITR